MAGGRRRARASSAVRKAEGKGKGKNELRFLPLPADRPFLFRAVRTLAVRSDPTDGGEAGRRTAPAGPLWRSRPR